MMMIKKKLMIMLKVYKQFNLIKKKELDLLILLHLLSKNKMIKSILEEVVKTLPKIK